MEDDSKYAAALILLIIIFISSLFFIFGLFYLEENPIFRSDRSDLRIKEIDIKEIPISTEEFLKINFTSLRDNLTQAGYELRNFSFGNKTGYIADNLGAENGFLDIEIYLNHENNSTYISGHYRFPCHEPFSYLSRDKELLKDSLMEVAGMAGINIDESSIEWDVSYRSGWLTEC